MIRFTIILAAAGLLAPIAAASAADVPRAEPAKLLSPLQLNPQLAAGLGEDERRRVQDAFVRITTPRVDGKQPAIPATVQYVHDPYTGKQVDAAQMARFAVEVQMAYARAGKTWRPGEAIDLGVLAPEGLKTIPQLPAVPVPPPAPRTAECTATPDADPFKDLASTWNQIKTARQQSKTFASIASFGFCDALHFATPVTAMPPAMTFGIPNKVQGSWSFTPGYQLGADGSLEATLRTRFQARVMSDVQSNILDALATVHVPGPLNKDPVTTQLSIGGDAISVPIVFGDRSMGTQVTLAGTPTKEYDFFSFEHSYPVAFASIKIRVGVRGNAKLDYAIDSNAFGLFVRAQPHVQASAYGQTSASVGVFDGSVDAQLTIQNGDGGIAALVAPVPFGGRTYVVSRSALSYQPFTVNARIVAQGHLMGFSWKRTLLDEKPVNFTVPYAFDSQWQVAGIY